MSASQPKTKARPMSEPSKMHACLKKFSVLIEEAMSDEDRKVI